MHKDIATNVTNGFFVKEQEAMVKSNISDEFLVPSLELIKTSMEEVFNNPRWIQKIDFGLCKEHFPAEYVS